MKNAIKSKLLTIDNGACRGPDRERRLEEGVHFIIWRCFVMTKERIVSVSEAAEFLGVPRELAYRAVKEGQIPSIQLGKRFYVPRQKL